MKKASLITNVVLAIAVIVLFVLHFISNSNSLKNDFGSGSAPAAGSVVYIQMDSLVNQYDMFNDLKSELESKAQVMQDDLNKKSMAFERDVKDFRQKVEKGLITRAQAEAQNAQLQNRERELQEYSQQRQMEMNEEQAVLVRKIMDALDKYLVKFNADKKYSMIINTSTTLNTVLQADSTLNITNMVVAGLNDEYVATKGKK
ncbi:MAG: OmpH family outer membrane protein [Bacteroidales bacterium]|nr:OmpH family outer membrane protein [Bacteroidales bacterium]